MPFDRYEILFNHYAEKIGKWDWVEIERRLTDYEPEGFDARYDDPLEGVYIGTTRGVFPSGKIYAPWTTNQTRADVIKDECFSEALQSEAQRRGMFIDYFDDCVFLIRPKK
jgi:hypothetical protein